MKQVAIYCRVSTEDQTLEQQKEPLIKRCKHEGWEYHVFEEKISGAKVSRTQLDLMMYALRNREFNTVLVWKLDRLGRSLSHLMQLVEEFNNKNIQFICLSPDVDTKSAQGMFFLQIMGAVAELERQMIRERVKVKLDYLKRKGVRLGRPPGSKDKRDRCKSGYYVGWNKRKQKISQIRC
ncbi:MAG: recombinase family protein [Nanoarchaeota archaeon]|nr:recombinase family protein [Nanoarchaeota archaeon]MBU1622680.1 recombinase family protein [Nanoarchaeota archaeon]MBU1973911.1 recombinase family protein [Nanoarchaeota archaeon]